MIITIKAGLTIIFILIALLFVRDAFASDALVIDTYTKHYGQCFHTVCQQPHRLSWQHDINDSVTTDVGAGTNSYDRFSINAGVMYQPLQVGILKAGIWASLVSGYTCDEIKTCVAAGGLVGTLTYDEIRVQMLYVPSFGPGTTAVINMRIGWEF